MGEVQIEDITVPWGAVPDPLDIQNGHWRMAVYQDCEEGFGGQKLYFLYDPVADENSGITGGRKGNCGLVVFDCNKRFFIGHIPLYLEGIVKFCFTLKVPSPANGSSFIIVTESDRTNVGGSVCLLLWRLYLGSTGMEVSSPPVALLNNPISLFGDYIIALREDVPELVLLTSPGLSVWRIPCLNPYPCDPIENFETNGDLSHYYDANVSQGNIYLHSSSPDGHYDPTRIHFLPLTGIERRISTQMCQGDYTHGFPCARKEVGLNAMSGYILFTGGEVGNVNGVQRLDDCWLLDLTNFMWKRIFPNMPVPLIEPRISIAMSGNVYVWGESDQPFPGVQHGTHLRILRVKGMVKPKLPSYNEAVNNLDIRFNPPYPNPSISQTSMASSYGYSPATYDSSYPSSRPAYSAPQNIPQLHYGQTNPGIGGNHQPFYPPSSEQHAYYPPEDKKNCCLQ